MITATSNKRIKWLVSLAEKAKERKKEQVFLVEGGKMFEEADEAYIREVYVSESYIEKNGITDVKAHLKPYIDNYNRNAVAYKKIGILKVREEEFPKNTLRKIMRFKLDMSID